MNAFELTYEKQVNDYVDALKYESDSRAFLEDFETDMRMGCYSDMTKQSNSQKMQLVLENFIAQNPENWKKWKSLKNKYREATLQVQQYSALCDYYKTRLTTFG